MARRRVLPQRPVSKADQYNAAAQFYYQELNMISQRTNAFLLTQSILLVVLATLLGIRGMLSSCALPYIVAGISLLGSFFCLLHYLAGHTGAMGASYWRRCMEELDLSPTLWSRVERVSVDMSRHEKCVRKISKWRKICRVMCWLCDLCNAMLSWRSLLDKLPWPAAWLITPLMFSLVWVGVSVCALIFVDEGWIRCASVAVTGVVLIWIVKGAIVWWRTSI